MEKIKGLNQDLIIRSVAKEVGDGFVVETVVEEEPHCVPNKDLSQRISNALDVALKAKSQ